MKSFLLLSISPILTLTGLVAFVVNKLPAGNNS